MEFLTRNELTRVLAEAKKSGAREHAMFLLGYLHGLRATEIANLTLNDIRGGKLRVQRLKGSLKSTQAIEAHAIDFTTKKLSWLHGLLIAQRSGLRLPCALPVAQTGRLEPSASSNPLQRDLRTRRR